MATSCRPLSPAAGPAPSASSPSPSPFLTAFLVMERPDADRKERRKDHSGCRLRRAGRGRGRAPLEEMHRAALVCYFQLGHKEQPADEEEQYEIAARRRGESPRIRTAEARREAASILCLLASLKSKAIQGPSASLFVEHAEPRGEKRRGGWKRRDTVSTSFFL